MFEKLKVWIKENKYCYVILIYIPYLIIFFAEDLLIKPKHIIDCPLDSYIPFNEYFLIPYSLWFAYFSVIPILFMFYDRESFTNLIFCMFSGIFVCFIVYLVWPNGLNLRVDVPDRNIFCWMLNHFIWKVDTPGNVCPSIHVSSSTAIAAAVLHSKMYRDKPFWRVFLPLFGLLICISTLFVKQHSIVDVICGASLTLIMYIITYHTNWKKIFYNTRFEFLVR